MNKFLFVVFILFVTFAFLSCGDKDENIVLESPYILGLTTNNYPIVDGSTSTLPLNMIIACKLFGIQYKWEYYADGTKGIKPISNVNNKIWRKIKSSQTHNSILNVIDNTAALALSARIMSPDEKTYSESKGVNLIETPIALDAFVFIVNPNNLIESLTINQIQDIYTKKITNWDEVGLSSADINPYVRNPNSGSQELMELLVMKDLTITDFPVSDFEVLFSMAGALDTVSYDINAICYSVYYYLENIAYMARDTVKTIAVDGINPTKTSIDDGSYPYVAEVYAIIRSDLDKSSMAYKIYEWLQTEIGKQVINESGYIPH